MIKCTVHQMKSMCRVKKANPKSQTWIAILALPVAASTLRLQVPALPQAGHADKRRRTEHEAILYACQKHVGDEKEQNKTLYIVDNLELRPFVIGTQVSNALVTSSIRLDRRFPPSVGGSTMNFDLNMSDSFACKIFVDEDAMKAAEIIISNPTTTCVSNIGMMSHQLRQVRTRFDSPKTFMLCRASGPLTKNHTCQPYTIFTLNECNRGGNPCSTLFDEIATEVLKNMTNATLKKSTVLACAKQATGKTKDVLDSILHLYQ